MNDLTPIDKTKPTPIQLFVQDVLAGEKRAEIANALPKHVSFARFERNLSNAVMREPKLLKVDPRVVFREVAKIAALGLVLDPQMGEAYLIVDNRGDVQARIGYRGLLKLAHQSGKCSAIYAHDICVEDHREIHLGTDKRLIHTPDFAKPRGVAEIYYACVKYKDGTTDFEAMSLGEIHAIREKSDAYKAFKRGAIKSTPWATDEGEMAKKTVLRRLLKRVPMSPDLESALAQEDEADYRDRTIDGVVTASRTAPLAGKLDALAGVGDETGDLPHDPETGEVTETGESDQTNSAEAGSAPNGDVAGAVGAEAGKTTSAPVDSTVNLDEEAKQRAILEAMIVEADAVAPKGTAALSAWLAARSEAEKPILARIPRRVAVWEKRAKQADEDAKPASEAAAGSNALAKADPKLLARGDEEASRGMQAIVAFWMKLTPAEQVAVGDAQRATWKKAAALADILAAGEAAVSRGKEAFDAWVEALDPDVEQKIAREIAGWKKMFGQE